MNTTVLRVAAFAVVTVLLTAFIGANIVGYELGRDRYSLTATFGDVAGLRGGDQVKLAGVAVGEVTGVEVDRGDAVVSFAVDESVELPDDSTITVRWLNLIGQRYLSLTPGTSASMLSDGDAVTKTGNVVDLGDLVNQLAPLARSISPEHVNRILTTLLAAFEGNDAAFDALLDDVDTVLQTLVDRQQTIDQMLVDYEVVSGALADRDAQIQGMITNLVAIADTFADNDALLAEALDELSTFSTGLDDLLSASADDLGSSLDSLAVLTGTAADHIGELEAALADLPGLFETTLSTVSEGEWLRVTVLCLTVAPGPCPYPTSLGDPPLPVPGGDP